MSFFADINELAAPRAAKNLARSKLTYLSFVLAATMLRKGSGSSGIGAKPFVSKVYVSASTSLGATSKAPAIRVPYFAAH